MARTAREHSDTGVYHAILRGVNKQQALEISQDAKDELIDNDRNKNIFDAWLLWVSLFIESMKVKTVKSCARHEQGI